MLRTDKFQPLKDTRHAFAPAQDIMCRVGDGSWTLVRFFTDMILPDGFHLDRFLTNSSIMISMVSHIVQHKRARSYELVVATSCLEFLSEKFQGLQLVVGYDPFESTEEDITYSWDLGAIK